MSIKFNVPAAPKATMLNAWKWAFPILIGVTGLKGHGKDTTVLNARRYIWNPRPDMKMFAAPLKEMTMAFLTAHGIPTKRARKYVYGSIQDKETVIPEIGKTSRHIQQTIGTEWGRDIMGSDVWVNALMSRYDNIIGHKMTPHWFITDVRFHNEADAIYKRGGHVIRVTNPRVSPSNDLHPSEAEIPHLKVSAEIINAGRKIDLARDMMEFYRHVYGIENPNASYKVTS